MKILHVQTVEGPNAYHRDPVLIMILDLENRAEVTSKDFPGFIERLLKAVPDLASHRCSPGYPGGFIERLHRGTYFGHIIEHVALGMSTSVGIEVGFGRTIDDGAPGVYRVIVRYTSERAMRELLVGAVEIVEACAEGRAVDAEPLLSRARALAEEEKLGPSTKAIIDAAEKRGIPWRRSEETGLIELGYGSQRKVIQATLTGLSSHLGVEVAQDKNVTKSLLSRMGLPVPRGEIVRTADEAVLALRRFRDSVTIKPVDGNQGKGVCVDLKSEESIRDAFEIAHGYSDSVIIEEFLPGKDFRALVVGGKLVAVAERKPPQVIGDGIHTIRELIDIENENPLRGDGHGKPMTKIQIDRSAENFLIGSGTRLSDIPRSGHRVALRGIANLSTGGSASDVTEEIHPEIQLLCERAARIVSLDVCGIDLILENISAPLSGQKGGIIEVNAAPGIRMHHFPTSGASRDAGGAIVDHLFPRGHTGRIPIVSVTGTNGKTTVTRLIGHVLNGNGHRRVGMTTSAGIYLGKNAISQGDSTGPASARRVLEDPWVDYAVLETARGGILRRGLGYDRADIAVITNVQADHIGQDGIEDVDDILRIKSVVAEHVRDGGTIVLNADDDLVSGIAARKSIGAERKRLAYFAFEETNPVLRRHLNAGGAGYFCRSGVLIESQGGLEIPLSQIGRIPLTLAGTAAYQIENILAAAAALRAIGVSAEEIRRGFIHFSALDDNSGRGNFYRYKDGIIVVDYGHNPEALRAVSRMAKRWKTSRITGIITAPGDRSDEMIRSSGRAAAMGFDRIIIREDRDLRGRKPGEIAELLQRAVAEARPIVDCACHLGEAEALEAAAKGIVEDEVIFIFYDDLSAVKKTLKRIGARPIHDVSELEYLYLGKSTKRLRPPESRSSPEDRILPPHRRARSRASASSHPSPRA